MKQPHAHTLENYVQRGGYAAMKQALQLAPEQIIEEVKASGLRGRGGAGFPTGMKWSFVPKDVPRPKYLCVNADESEPGTFKDHLLMERNPHLLFEGCVIACRSFGAKTAYIYIRGEFYHVQRVLEAELAKAYAQGYLGKDILGSGQDCDIYVHRGAGAYEAGEESALLESLEGKRAQPRLRPALPGRGRPLRVPDHHQQRRDHLQRADHPPARRGVVPLDRPREERRAQALLHQRARGPAGRLRDVDGRHAAGADLRLRRRHEGRQGAQGDHPRADPRSTCSRRPASTPRPASTAWSRPARCSARPR